MDDKERQLVEEALASLQQVDDDRWHCDDDCTIDTPVCHTMHNRAAAKKLRALIEPEMRSLQPDRLTNPAERIYHDRWVKYNERHSGVNSGNRALELILCPTDAHPSRPTQRDAEVATSVIQWLGTNCGNGFMRMCEEQITRELAERRELDYLSDRLTHGWRDRDLFERMVDSILKDILPKPSLGVEKWATNVYGLAKLRSEIMRVLQTSFMLFAYATGKIDEGYCADSLGYGGEEFKKLYGHAIKALDDRMKRLEKRRAEKVLAALSKVGEEKAAV